MAYLPTTLGTYRTAEELSTEIKQKHGLDIPAERLLGLARGGHLAFRIVDGKGPYFDPRRTKAWIRDNLISDHEPIPLPGDLAAFDARTWEGMENGVPPELSLIERQLREIPIAPFRWPPGIYFLVKDQRVVYVGQSIGLMARLLSHFKDKEFDRIFFLPVLADHLSQVELAFIRRLRPKYNSTNNLAADKPYHVDLDRWFGVSQEEEIDRIEAYWQEIYRIRKSRNGMNTVPTIDPAAE